MTSKNTLTPKQEAFTRYLFEGLSQREAWIKAGYSSKYSVEVIDVNACKLAAQNKVQLRIAELKQKAEDKSIASVLERKQVLTEIVRGRFIDFMSKPTPEKLRSAALQEIRIQEHTDKDGESHKTTTMKLNDPVKAISELNKMEHIYVEAPAVNIDNRKVEIYVGTEKTRQIVEKIIEGKLLE